MSRWTAALLVLIAACSDDPPTEPTDARDAAASEAPAGDAAPARDAAGLDAAAEQPTADAAPGADAQALVDARAGADAAFDACAAIRCDGHCVVVQLCEGGDCQVMPICEPGVIPPERECFADCKFPQLCLLKPVECIQPPCPSLPTCVDTNESCDACAAGETCLRHLCPDKCIPQYVCEPS
jgi:hypothetical protein